ncbi:MAG: beta-N-acetylhexosaminidase [Acidobacteriota bacterium]
MSDVGGFLFVGFGGTHLTPETRAFLRAIRPGGIILFSRNITGAEQVLELIADLKSLYSPAPVLGIDEEGGRVSRLRPLSPTLPPAARLAESGDPSLVREMAASLGEVLAALGFDLDFAPVVDLCRATAPNGIADRSFGIDPETTCAMAGAYLEGLREAGIAGCLKHFPGLGPTGRDSHQHLPRIDKPEADFRRDDLLPFRRLQARAPAIMIGHGYYPFLAPHRPLPATLARSVASDLLRGEVGFKGLALADDLEMKAASSALAYEELAPRAFIAGCDMLLVCSRRDAIEHCRHGLLESAERGLIDEDRLRAAGRRLDALRSHLRPVASDPPCLERFESARADLISRLEAATG